uniref:NACHT domain-containing protein n=1 Tax=Naja naja TaxID=35670 RepID=A0A8C6VB35_NAJNA
KLWTIHHLCRYSKLIILDYHPSEEEREDEILAMGRKHLEIMSKRADSSTSIETLFNPDKYGLIPQVVVLQGAAGIGKTITAKKIIFDWASQLLYQDKFNYVFYICCRKINVHAESEKSSIAEIISEEWLKCHESKNVIQNILKNEEKLLFIIDGFDELKYSFDQSENYFFFPKSSLIITTRPTALEKLHQCLERPRNVEILGFSVKERQEYFHKFFENGVQATQALRFVKQNDTLFTMCVIPLVSWIICTVVKQEMESGKDLQKIPYTLTAIYMLYLSSLLKFHHKEAKQDVQSNVKGLCSLAAEGVWKQKTLFMEEEVKKYTLNQGDFLPLFLNQSIFKRGIDCIQTYSFVHLSFQEFFAALFYILEKGEELHAENWNKILQMLLKRDKSFRADFAVGFRFLFGFLNEKRMKELKQEFGWEISPKIKEFLLDCVKDSITKTRPNFQLQKEMLSYLYETQDDNFIKNAICDITEIAYHCNSDMELMILGYCIQHCQNLKYLYVKVMESIINQFITLYLKSNTRLSKKQFGFRKKLSCNLQLLHCKNIWATLLDQGKAIDAIYIDFWKAFDSVVHDKLLLKLNSYGISRSLHMWITAFLSNRQQIVKIGRAISNPTPVNSDAPQGSVLGPTLFILYINDLCDHLISNCVLFADDVKLFNTTEDATVLQSDLDYVSEWSNNCESSSRHLAEVLRKNQRLRTLSLSLNNPDDQPLKELCEGLKYPSYFLQSRLVRLTLSLYLLCALVLLWLKLKYSLTGRTLQCMILYTILRSDRRGVSSRFSRSRISSLVA